MARKAFIKAVTCASTNRTEPYLKKSLVLSYNTNQDLVMSIVPFQKFHRNDRFKSI